MRKIILSLIAITFCIHTLTLSAQEAASTQYSIDSGHTFVRFEVNRFGMVDVSGYFRNVSGIIIYDDTNPLEMLVDVKIETGSLETGLEARDKAVKSKAFLDVDTYPSIIFKSKDIKQNSDGYIMVGDLTIHGKTNEVSFQFDLSGPYTDPTKKLTISAKAELLINRQDYGMAFNKVLDNGKAFIGNEIFIDLNMLAEKKQ